MLRARKGGRVLHVISSTDRRGAEVFAVGLDDVLRSRGWESTVVALAPGDGTDPLAVPVLGSRRFRGLRRLRRLASDNDVVVAHGSSTLPACAIALLGTGVPFVYRNIGSPSYWASSPWRRFRVQMFLRRARRVAALWPGSASTLTASFGVAPEKIVVIPNGRPRSLFPRVTPDVRSVARRRLGLPPSASVVVYVGALSVEKGVDVLLDAMLALPDVLLLVAGDGAERASLEHRAAAAHDRVRFLGSMADPSSVLAAADAVVLPSRTEGLPAAAIEAGLAGLPVVATDVGGTSEVVVDGVTGVLVEAGSAAALILGIKQALAERASLGSAAHERCVARFELGVVASRWEELLADLSAGA